MISRIDIIALNIKRRKRKRVLKTFGMIGLPILMVCLLMIWRSSEMRPSYQAVVPTVAAAETEMPQKHSEKEAVLVSDSISFIPAENAKTDTSKQLAEHQDSLTSPIQSFDNSPTQIVEVEKSSPAVPPPALESPTEKPDKLYISMPDYSQMPLKRKMDLMRNTAYSPKEKTLLRTHIIYQFANRSRARVSVIDRNPQGQRETRSYPIGMYLDRLNKHPQLQFRLVEKVHERGQLAGLVVRE